MQINTYDNFGTILQTFLFIYLFFFLWFRYNLNSESNKNKIIIWNKNQDVQNANTPMHDEISTYWSTWSIDIFNSKLGNDLLATTYGTVGTSAFNTTWRTKDIHEDGSRSEGVLKCWHVNP